MIATDPAGHPHGPASFVFGDTIGRQVKDPKKRWLKCCAAAGVTGLHFHDLRHEAGSRLLEAGWRLHDVSAQLGHSNIKTTDTYLNSTTQNLVDSMRRFGSGSLLHELAHGEKSERPSSGQQPTPESPNVLVN